MNTDIPKPYLTLGGRTVLEQTLRRFLTMANLDVVVVATSPAYREQTEEILSGVFPHIETIVVQGGAERQDSIRNALAALPESIGLIAVHDAVRPFVQSATIQSCVQEAAATGAAIAGVVVKDTIKKADAGLVVIETPDRRQLWQAQTPQVFRAELLHRAYQKAQEDGFTGTDDASLVERLGVSVTVVPGSRDNFKLTYPIDFQIAEMLHSKSKP